MAEPEELSDSDFLPDDAPAPQSRVRPPTGVWRQGPLLVVRKGADLPARCIKSNEPTDQVWKRTLYWHHPAIYLAILPGVIFYVILALALRKTAVLRFGLSPGWLSRRRWGIATGWLIALGGIGLMFSAGAARSDGAQLACVLGGIVTTLIIGPVWGVLRSRLVVPTRMTDDYVWVKGICPEYLADLREFPRDAS